jgi:general secretion pathway protein I
MDSDRKKLCRRSDSLIRDGVLCPQGLTSSVSISDCRGRERPRDAGFSLVEILCAVLVLGIALVGMVQGVTAALSSNKESELQTVAAQYAAGQVETLRAEGDLRDGVTDGDCGEGLPLYRWQQTVSATGIDGLHEVAVSVENAKSGKTIYELRTLLFEVPDSSKTSSSNTKRDSASQRRRNGSR